MHQLPIKTNDILSSFSTFSFLFCAFASPSLLPVIRESLDLTSLDMSLAALSSASGTLFGRLLMAPASDLLGTRIASASFCFISTPFIFFMATNSASPCSFILIRFFSGFSLSCLKKRTSLYVSTSSANLGYTATQLFMPYVYSYYVQHHGILPATAWRTAYFIPAALQVWTMLVLMAFEDEDADESISSSLGCEGGVWIVGMTYGSCCGVEIVMQNIVAECFYDVYGFEVQSAGVVAAGYGVASMLGRLGGGVVSKEVGERFGVRGQLWVLWVVQCLGGLICLGMWKMMKSFASGIIVVIGIAVLVQASAGIIIDMVSSLSNRSNSGTNAGITGSIGAFGAVTTQIMFSIGSHYSIEVGTFFMGVMILLYALPITFVYSTEWGGMFRAPALDTFEFDDEYQLLK